MLKSPQSINLEAVLSVLNFSGSVYHIKIGKLRGILSPNNAFCVFWLLLGLPLLLGETVYILCPVLHLAALPGFPPHLSKTKVK